MHFLITGHTGFKGTWLTLMLHALGHQVSGISLDPAPGVLYETAHLNDLMAYDKRIDIRDANMLKNVVDQIQPDVIMHLAAQPLVRLSYQEPRFTYETNVMGTYNILEAAQSLPGLKALVMVTTDKVYKNVNRVEGYREDESLGGDDPYSASKAMADLLIQSWVKSFPGVPTAIVRGGNVIGGGDVSADRLLVDLISGFQTNAAINIRYPDAVRPWQHVLDCLNGYLMVAAALLRGEGQGAWNIGPDERSFVSVREITETSIAFWDNSSAWVDNSNETHLHEANLLAIDATKANRDLKWRDHIAYPESLEWTLDWAKRVFDGEAPLAVTQEQIAKFLKLEDLNKLP